MRMVKVRRPDPRRKTCPSNVIAQILLDVRNLCSGYRNYKPKTIIGVKIYQELKEHGKTHIFNVSNFPSDLWEQMKQILNILSNVPAYLVYGEGVLESEQASYLSKYLPVYPENPELHLKEKIRKVLESKKNSQKGGDSNGIQWE